MGGGVNEKLKENNKLFWQEVKKSRREACAGSKSILDKPGRMPVTKNKLLAIVS